MEEIKYGDITMPKVSKSDRIELANMTRIISSYSGDEFEKFILEWLKYCKNEINENTFIAKVGSTGDMGIDIFCKNNNETIYYQAKQYRKSLTESEVMLIICKILWHVFKSKIEKPQKLYIVASNGISKKVLDILSDNVKLKNSFISSIDKTINYVSKNINDDEIDNFNHFVKSLPFDFVKHQTVDDIIIDYYNSPLGAIRFNKPVNIKFRKNAKKPNYEIQRYAAQINNIFNGCSKKKDILNDANNSYYSALCLKETDFYLFNNNDEFEKAKDDVFQGVNMITYREIPDNEKYIEVLKQAVLIEPSSSFLASAGLHIINNSDKKGLCHYLVNEEKFNWESELDE